MAVIATKALDFDLKAVEFTFTGSDPVSVPLSSFSEEIILHLGLYGLSQKLGDAYSACKGDVAAAIKMFETTLAQLTAGDWRASRGEGTAKPRASEFAAALARIKNLPVEDVIASLGALDPERLKKLRSNEKVKAVIAIIRAEKAQAALAKAETTEGGLEELDIG